MRAQAPQARGGGTSPNPRRSGSIRPEHPPVRRPVRMPRARLPDLRDVSERDLCLRSGSAAPRRASPSALPPRASQRTLDPLFGARRPARVVLVRLVHVAVALAVLDAGEDVAEQGGLATLKLPGEFVQD